MATNFPSSADSFTNPTSGDTLDNPPHDQQHANINDAMEAVQASLLDGAPLHIDDANNRVGIGTASPATTLEVDGVLTANHIHGNIAGAVYLHVKNTSGVTIPAGSPVYATGSVGASGETEIAISDADNASTMPALGVIDTQLVNNAEGHAIVLGVATGLDTSGFAINDKLYVSTSGGLTNVRPTGASELVQKIARVIRSDASTGIILVGAGRSNDVPNNIVAGGLTIDTDTLHVDATNDRVGIGTTSPSSILDLSSTSSTLSISDSDGTVGGSMNAMIQYKDSSGSVQGQIGYGTGVGYMIVDNNDGPMRVGTASADSLYLRTNAANRIAINSAGDVGINDTTPSYKLDVNGDARVTGRLGIGGGISAELDIKGASNPEIRLQSTDSTDPFLYFGDQVDPVRGGIGFDTSANNLLFRRYNNITAMTLTSAGNLGIGTTSPTRRLQVNGTARIDGDLEIEGYTNPNAYSANIRSYASSSVASIGSASTSDGNRNHVVFSSPSYPTAGIIRTQNGACYYSSGSDHRLKSNVVPISDAVNVVSQLKPSEFVYTQSPDVIHQGFIAHELQQHIPSAVSGVLDEVDDEGNPVYQTVDLSRVVPVLTAALQEALTTINDLTARIEALEAG